MDMSRPIRVYLDDQPAIDMGGVRRQFFNDVFEYFTISSSHIQLFEGPINFLRPVYSPEARSSGLLKALGKMVAHGISLEGIGFPYLSPLCYWYIVGGEDKAMEHLTMADVGADVEAFIIQVCLMGNFLV